MAIPSATQRTIRMVCLASLSLASSMTLATSLDALGVIGQVQFNRIPPAGLNVSTVGTFPLTGPGGFLQLSVSGEPSPFLSAEAHIAPGFSGDASGIVAYSMSIIGPEGEVPVSITVSGGASGSSSVHPFTGFALKAQWRLEDVSLGLAKVFEEGINTPALQGIFSESFGHTLDFTLNAGHVYRVTMIADAFAGAVDSDSQTFATAFIDPVFSFGAGVGPEYSFAFSPGVGNTPVPLPAPVALLAPALLMFVPRARRLGPA